MYLGFVLFCISRTSRTSLENRGRTSSLVSPKYSISVCPKDDSFSIFLNFASVIFNKTFFKCFELFLVFLVKNSQDRIDAHRFTYPLRSQYPIQCYLWYNNSLTLMFKPTWPFGFRSISCVLLFDMLQIRLLSEHTKCDM